MAKSIAGRLSVHPWSVEIPYRSSKAIAAEDVRATPVDLTTRLALSASRASTTNIYIQTIRQYNYLRKIVRHALQCVR